jgi:hypothetical protein
MGLWENGSQGAEITYEIRGLVEVVNVKKKPDLIVDFNTHRSKSWNKTSHLHKVKPLANPGGNRAERREYKRLMKKKGK